MYKNIATDIYSKNPWILGGTLSNVLTQENKSKVPLVIAEKFISETIWWNTHISGNPVRSAKYVERICYDSSHGWIVQFGANSFLISKAILRCGCDIYDFIEDFQINKNRDIDSLVTKLKMRIAGSVANQKGEYSGYYPLVDNQLIFGSQSIHALDGALFLIKLSGVNQFFDILSLE